jgi:hypothetical protein
MAPRTVRNCEPDPSRLGVLAECRKITNPPGTGDEWPGQFLSTRTIAFSCGMLARQGDGAAHAHDADELKRCRRLAAEAVTIMKGVQIGGADEGDHPAYLGAPVRRRSYKIALLHAGGSSADTGDARSEAPLGGCVQRTARRLNQTPLLRPVARPAPARSPTGPVC